MSVSDFITVQPEKTIFGKRTGRYMASMGEVKEFGEIKETAVHNLYERIRNQFQNNYAREYFWSSDKKTVFCLYYCDGWCYDIIGPDSNHASQCRLATDSRSEAREAMKRHAAEYSN
jgi:hypothetical protein